MGINKYHTTLEINKIGVAMETNKIDATLETRRYPRGIQILVSIYLRGGGDILGKLNLRNLSLKVPGSA